MLSNGKELGCKKGTELEVSKKHDIIRLSSIV